MNRRTQKKLLQFKKKELRSLNTRKNKRLTVLALLLLTTWTLLILSLLSAYLFETKYYNKIYPGVTLGPYNLSGSTTDEVDKIINRYKSDLETNGIIFSYKNKEAHIFPLVIAPADPDLTYELFNINAKDTKKELFKIGRDQGWWDNLKTKARLIKNSKKVKLQHHIYEENINQALREIFKEQEIPARDAQLKIDQSLEIIIIPEEEGVVPDYKAGIESLKRNLQQLSLEPIILSAQKDYPQVKAQALQNKKLDIESLFTQQENLSLEWESQTWLINKNTYKNWLDVESERLLFNENLSEYLKKNLASFIEIPVQEARFILNENGKVEEFKPSQNGRKIAYEQTLATINKTFFADLKTNEPIKILTESIKPQHTTESVNDLGIKNLLGTGRSNFAGSPQNRSHNIKVGADTLNGLLIPPNEEFSLAKALGDINDESGYLPELVIKGNKTIPEFGGGLCQIGTTLFRGALDSGLPITERRSHSYRVVYYEPAGTDCTIYPPHPDCRFFNDSDSYILLQTRIEGNDLIFDFWGTDDGREVTITKPEIYNITKPPPTKYIETEDLPPGETKCTERAHNGAETKFDYIVKYPAGHEMVRTFLSYYKPWQAVCLIGKARNEKEMPPAVAPEAAVE